MDDECADDSAVELPAYFLGSSLQHIKKLVTMTFAPYIIAHIQKISEDTTSSHKRSE